MSKVYRAYVLGYRREWAEKNKEFCKNLIAEVDLCIDHPKGIYIGEIINIFTILDLEGNTNENIPKKLKCISHEFGGKVVNLIDYSD